MELTPDVPNEKLQQAHQFEFEIPPTPPPPSCDTAVRSNLSIAALDARGMVLEVPGYQLKLPIGPRMGH